MFTNAENQIIQQSINLLESKFKIHGELFNDVSAVKDFLRLQMSHCEREHFAVFFLDNQLRLIEYKILFSGTINSCPVFAREIIKEALRLNASALIIAHNHPSGDPTPSSADIAMTKQIKEIVKVLDIRLLDHLVVGQYDVISFEEEYIF